MTDNTRTGLPELKALSGTGATLFAATGFAAAFGAASCCALPMLLGSLGLGSAWLASLALFAGPHRAVLLAAAIVCLVSGGALLRWRYQNALVCAPGAACSRSVVTRLITGVLSLGAVLTVLGLVFA
ncbi:MAG TPA: mercuric transporter MerT family protein [Stellaceae bacterium]|jgi:mercuric ion transport protein|nr:mercuric transporter MerT family protein [Stellaceae bacterium]